MSRVRYVLLCEDLRQARFLREVLKRQSGDFEEIRPPRIAPFGKGDAKKFIVDRFPQEVAVLRSKSYQKGLGLAVVIDADNLSTQQRRETLLAALSPNNLSDQQPIGFIIPRWCIETWIVFLRDGHADETEKCATYKQQVDSRDVRPAARTFADTLNAPPQDWLPSLREAADELSAWMKRLSPNK